jgi:hypothetical protein
MPTVSIRAMIDDVPTAIRFYTTHLGFAIEKDASPASFVAFTRQRGQLLFISVDQRFLGVAETVVSQTINSQRPTTNGLK